MERHQQQSGKGLHEVSETVHLYNPSNGWLQNCTLTQLLAQKVQRGKTIYPTWRLMEKVLGINAVRLLSKGEKYTLDKVIV
jgi:hypothetical protein